MREFRRAVLAAIVLCATMLAPCAARPSRPRHDRQHTKANGVITYTFDPPEPGLGEVDAGGWYGNSSLSIPGQAVTQGPTYGAFSPPNALGIPAMYLTGPTRSFEGVAVKDRIDTQPGLPLGLSTMVNADATVQAIVLRMDVYDRNDDDTSGALIGSFICGKSTFAAGWQSWSAGTVTPSQSAIRIIITVRDPLHAANTSGRWLIDNFSISIGEGEMARLLSAFGTRAVMSRALASLNAEIGYIKSETGLAYDLPQFTAWRGYNAYVASPDVVEFEVYTNGPLSFNLDKDAKTNWNANQRTNAYSSVPMIAAINHANRGDADHQDADLLASQMEERSDLYGAAIFRCYENDPTCGYGVSLEVVPVHVVKGFRDVRDQKSGVGVSGRVEYHFVLKIRETADGETIANSSVLPVVNMETP